MKTYNYNKCSKNSEDTLWARKPEARGADVNRVPHDSEMVVIMTIAEVRVRVEGDRSLIYYSKEIILLII